MKIEKIKAKSVSYGPMRALSEVEYQVIHYTGNNGDTAQGNGKYFRDSNTRAAGAHFFISQNGDVVESIPMELTAWSVGGDHRSGKPGEAKYYKKCTSYNSVSIELCDNENKPPSEKQIKACKELISYIKSHCKNANTIIRHWDVNGKSCPSSYLLNDANWKAFVKKVASGMSSSGGGMSSNNIIKRGQTNANKFLSNHMDNPKQITTDGIRGPQTRAQCARVVQLALNMEHNAKLDVDGVFGKLSKGAIENKSIKKGNKNYLVLAVKILYQCKGKDKGLKYSRTFGSGLEKTAGKTKITADNILGLLD